MTCRLLGDMLKRVILNSTAHGALEPHAAPSPAWLQTRPPCILFTTMNSVDGNPQAGAILNSQLMGWGHGGDWREQNHLIWTGVVSKEMSLQVSTVLTTQPFPTASALTHTYAHSCTHIFTHMFTHARMQTPLSILSFQEPGQLFSFVIILNVDPEIRLCLYLNLVREIDEPE